MERLLTVRPHYFILRDREQSSGTIAAGQTDWEGWYTVFPSTLGLIKNHVLSWASAAVCMRGASGRVIDPPECLKSLQCHPSGPLSLTHNRQTYQHVGGRGEGGSEDVPSVFLSRSPAWSFSRMLYFSPSSLCCFVRWIENLPSDVFSSFFHPLGPQDP